MTIEDFTIETTTLEEMYDKKFNFTQKQMWYEELQNYPVEKYRRAIRQICKTSQYRPTLNAILETIRTLKNELQEKETVKCSACKGTGYIIYCKKIEEVEYKYACLCNCKNAIGLEYDGTKIADKEHRTQFYLAKSEDIFLNKNFKPEEIQKQMKF